MPYRCASNITGNAALVTAPLYKFRAAMAAMIILVLILGFSMPVLAKSAKTKAKIKKDAAIITKRYQVIVKKDPFDKERGGSEAGEGTGTEAPVEGISENYELYGVIRTGNIRKAFLKEKNSKKSRVRWNRKKKRLSRPKFRIVTEGDLIDGWKVREITPTGIVLSSNDQTVEMKVFTSQKSNRRALKPVAMQTRPTPLPVTHKAATPSTGKKAASKPGTSKSPSKLVPGKPSGQATPPSPPPRPRRNPFSRVLKTSTSTGIKTPPAETPDDQAILSPEDITVPPLNLPGK